MNQPILDYQQYRNRQRIIAYNLKRLRLGLDPVSPPRLSPDQPDNRDQDITLWTRR